MEAQVANSKIHDWAQRNKLLLNREKCTSTGATIKQGIILVNHWCHRIILFIAQISLVIMLVTVFMNVVLRYCFNSGITWAEEVPRLLVTLFTFLACAIGCRDHMHISVGLVYNRFKEGSKARKFLDVLSDIAVLLCGIALLYYGIMYIVNHVYRKIAPGNTAYDRLAHMAAVHSSSYRGIPYDFRPAIIPFRHRRS